MASTRQSPPMKIFQDPELGFDFDTATANVNFDLAQPLPSPLDTLPPLLPDMNPFGPVGAGPVSCEGGNSPVKRPHSSSSPPRRAPFSEKLNVSLPQPNVQPAKTGSPLKRLSTSSYQPIAPHLPTNGGHFPIFHANKENMRPPCGSDNLAEFPSEADGYKRPAKRSLQDADPLDAANKKAKTEAVPAAPVVLPNPQDMPTPRDDGTKPNHSYAQLIGMAILRGPNRRLTLAQIYKWISETFSHYRGSEAGWQNSIRHNLSLSKHFIKQERPKDDPGKGNYWTIKPGEEHHYLHQKTRRPTAGSATLKVFQPSLQPSSEPNTAPASTPLASKKDEGKKKKKPAPAAEEPSSEATIPASDPALLEDDDEPTMLPPVSRGPLSSPIDNIRSSPPIARRPLSREGTPGLHEGSSSVHNSRNNRKRKRNAMNDSGYFSSLESSAMRPHLFGAVDREPVAPRFKRGRAEEEIARIRSSSHDISPTRSRAAPKATTGGGPSVLSSSPTRQPDNPVLPPLTPAVTFKKPFPRPPPVPSPNTNLRNHRNKIKEMIGSPLKSFSVLEDDDDSNHVTFSPAFNMDDDDDDALLGAYAAPGSLAAAASANTLGFDIFVDSNSPIARKFAASSPEKRSLLPPSLGSASKRPGLLRAHTTASALADVTGTSLNAANSPASLLHTGLTPNPSLKPPLGFDSPLRGLGRSPSKLFYNNSSPSKMFSPFRAVADDLDKGDFWGLDLFVDENGGAGADADADDGFGGLDLLGGGWRQIGEKEKDFELGLDVELGKENMGMGSTGKLAKGAASASKKRPALGARRETTRF